MVIIFYTKNLKFTSSSLLSSYTINRINKNSYFIKSNLVNNYFISLFIKNEIDVPKVSSFFLKYLTKNPTELIKIMKTGNLNYLFNFFLKNSREDDEFIKELLILVDEGIVTGDFLIYHTVFTPLAKDVATVVVLAIPVVVFLYTSGAFMEAINPPDYED